MELSIHPLGECKCTSSTVNEKKILRATDYRGRTVVEKPIIMWTTVCQTFDELAFLGLLATLLRLIL
jgi:hypothetical protein